MRKNINFDGSCGNYLMRNNSFTVGFNMPDALSGETTFALPPYAKRMPYLVDKYPACPKNWLRSEGIVKSFFVPVTEGRGMWLDFNENENHTHHIAVVISVQGINPITGLPCKDAQLEQYIEECPKHKIKFGPDRYCSKCDYKWPKQNYISTTGTPRGMFWLDGFRTIEGIVRQYILTAEKMKGVASNIIGKDRVYAIGLSFFVSKEKKPKTNKDIGDILRSTTTNNYYPYHTPTPPNWCTDFKYDIYPTWTVCDNDNTMRDTNTETPLPSGTTNTSYLCSCSLDADIAKVKKQLAETSNDPNWTITTHHAITVKNLEVGAGAKINQVVYDDPEKLDFWHDKPESIICINYASESDVCKILEQGEVNLDGHIEGFLKSVPVGN